MKIVINNIIKIFSKKHDIVFYAETFNDHLHFKKLLYYLVKQTQIKITYISSVDYLPVDDLILNYKENFNFYYIGKSYLRTFIFPNISSKVMILSMTDLNTFYLKKGKNINNYIYIFHSLNSTHRAYLPNAFDSYDTIFCTGPHHNIEIRERESLEKLPKKKLINFGHYIIDDIENFDNNKIELEKIIIAPTWGPSSIYENLGDDFFYKLAETGFKIVLKFHSMSEYRKKYFKSNFDKLAKLYKNIEIDYGNLTFLNLHQSITMISDWSGAATEYSFALRREVNFIETKPKIRNENFSAIKLPIFEDKIRNEIGDIYTQNNTDHLIEKIITKKYDFNIDNHLIKNQNIYNNDKNFILGVNYILNKI